MPARTPTRFSVIIPTRQRADTLQHSLRTVTAQNYDNLEILVSDNCSGDDTREIVTAAGDPRVRYLDTGRRISMSANWEFALGHATGDWITIVGDDDGLVPGALDVVNDLIEATGAEAIRTRACWFEWPSITQRPSGRLHVVVASGWERRQSEVWRARLLAGRAHYYDLPMLYTGGFVSASAIARGRMVDGRFYRSSAPDIYSALLLSRLLPEYVFAREPVAVFGTSSHSTGGSLLQRTPTPASGPRPIDTYYEEGNIPLHRSIPTDSAGRHPRNIQALVYESYLQVADILPEPREESPARQLIVILATAGAHSASLQDWGRRFASLHGLDFDASAAAARRYKLQLALAGLPEQAARLLRTRVVGCDTAPIANVNDASVVAGLVKASPLVGARFLPETIRARLARVT